MRNQPQAVADLFAQDRFAEDMGVTRETLWRWRRDGLLRTINIRGRQYVTAEEVADFKRRALAGQFAKPAKRPPRVVPAVRSPAANAIDPCVDEQFPNRIASPGACRSVVAANYELEARDDTRNAEGVLDAFQAIKRFPLEK